MRIEQLRGLTLNKDEAFKPTMVEDHEDGCIITTWLRVACENSATNTTHGIYPKSSSYVFKSNCNQMSIIAHGTVWHCNH